MWKVLDRIEARLSKYQMFFFGALAMLCAVLMVENSNLNKKLSDEIAKKQPNLIVQTNGEVKLSMEGDLTLNKFIIGANNQATINTKTSNVTVKDEFLDRGTVKQTFIDSFTCR